MQKFYFIESIFDCEANKKAKGKMINLPWTLLFYLWKFFQLNEKKKTLLYNLFQNNKNSFISTLPLKCQLFQHSLKL